MEVLDSPLCKDSEDFVRGKYWICQFCSRNTYVYMYSFRRCSEKV